MQTLLKIRLQLECLIEKLDGLWPTPQSPQGISGIEEEILTLEARV